MAQNTEGLVLPYDKFSHLVVVGTALLECALSHSDFRSARLFIKPALLLRTHDGPGQQKTLLKSLRTQKIWQNVGFWLFNCYDGLHDTLLALHGPSNINNILGQYHCLPANLQQTLEHREQSAVTDHISKTVKLMMDMSVPLETIRHFLHTMCEITLLPAEPVAELQAIFIARSKEYVDAADAHKQEENPQLQMNSFETHLMVVGTGKDDIQANSGSNYFHSVIYRAVMELLNNGNVDVKSIVREGGRHSKVVARGNTDDMYIVRTFQGHTESVLCVDYDSGGKGGRLFSSSCDTTVRVWDLTDTKCLSVLAGHTGWVNCLKAVPDEGTLVSGSYDNKAIIWDVNKEQRARTLACHSGTISSIAIAPPFVVTASYDSTVACWDMRAKKPASVLEGHTLPVTSVSVAGHLLISGSQDNTARLWDFRAGKWMYTLVGHKDWVTAVKAEVDSERRLLLASASCDGTIKLWNKDDGRCICTMEGHAGPVEAINFLRDGSQLVSCSRDATVRVWDTAAREGKPVASPSATFQGHTKQVVEVVPFLGSMVVSGSHDSTLKVWGLRQRKLLHTLYGHAQCISSLTICPPNRIISGSWDGTIKLWEFDLHFRGKK